jgi:hypothetical protein
MIRRSFLGALLGLAAAPVLAKLAPLGLEAPRDMKMLGHIDGMGFVVGIDLAWEERIGGDGFRLYRPGMSEPVMQLPAGGYTEWGMTRWLARIDYADAIAFVPDAPLVIDIPPGAEGRIVYWRDGAYRARKIKKDGSTIDQSLRATADLRTP